MIRALLVFLVLFSSNLFAADMLRLKTDPPGANVFIRDIKSDRNQMIGNTPFESDIDKLVSGYAPSSMFVLTIEKDGFETQSIIMGNLLKTTMNLSLILKPKVNFLEFKKIDKSINVLFEAQRLIRAQQYDEAISILKRAEVDQEYISIIPELIASTYYLKRDMAASLTWYEKAFRINPENKDAFLMKSYLRKSLGLLNEN